MSLKDPVARREYHRQWRIRNRARLRTKHLAYQQDWRARNPDKQKEYSRRATECRAKNIEKYRARERASWAAHRDARIENCRVWRSKNVDKIREYERESRRQYRQEFRNKHPDKYTARRMLNNAVRRGSITRLACWCGAKGQAHHEDYTKPYEVMWLCGKHHAELHRKPTYV